MNTEWHKLSEQPPDELLQVIDSNGNTAFANPTYYPFRVLPKQGKWKSEIEPCDDYWDGGWLVMCEGLTSSIGLIVGWREAEP